MTAIPPPLGDRPVPLDRPRRRGEGRARPGRGVDSKTIHTLTHALVDAEGRALLAEDELEDAHAALEVREEELRRVRAESERLSAALPAVQRAADDAVQRSRMLGRQLAEQQRVHDRLAAQLEIEREQLAVSAQLLADERAAAVARAAETHEQAADAIRRAEALAAGALQSAQETVRGFGLDCEEQVQHAVQAQLESEERASERAGGAIADAFDIEARAELAVRTQLGLRLEAEARVGELQHELEELQRAASAAADVAPQPSPDELRLQRALAAAHRDNEELHPAPAGRRTRAALPRTRARARAQARRRGGSLGLACRAGPGRGAHRARPRAVAPRRTAEHVRAPARSARAHPSRRLTPDRGTAPRLAVAAPVARRLVDAAGRARRRRGRRGAAARRARRAGGVRAVGLRHDAGGQGHAARRAVRRRLHEGHPRARRLRRPAHPQRPRRPVHVRRTADGQQRGAARGARLGDVDRAPRPRLQADAGRRFHARADRRAERGPFVRAQADDPRPEVPRLPRHAADRVPGRAGRQRRGLRGLSVGAGAQSRPVDPRPDELGLRLRRGAARSRRRPPRAVRRVRRSPTSCCER